MTPAPRLPSDDLALLKALLAFAKDVRNSCRAELEARRAQVPPDTEKMLALLSDTADALLLSRPAFLHHFPAHGTLTVVAAPSPADVGTTYALRGHPVALGRNREALNTVVLSDPDVSRKHAVIDVLGQRHRLSDSLSTNRTLVNGVTITQVDLAPGDRITVGGTVLEFHPA